MSEVSSWKKPRFQFRLRTLLLLPLLCAAGIVLNAGIGGAVWDGYRDVEFRYVVVDAETSRPIQNATLSLIDPDVSGTPTQRQESSDGEGRIRYVERCQAGGKDSLFYDRGSVIYPWWALEVTAEGYEPSGRFLLRDRLGNGKDIHDPDPPPLRIELRKGIVR